MAKTPKAPKIGTGLLGRAQDALANRPKRINNAVEGSPSKPKPAQPSMPTSKPTAKNPKGVEKTKSQGDAELAALRAKQRARTKKKAG